MAKRKHKKLTKGQKWWRRASSQEKAHFIDKIVTQKRAKRIARTKRWLRDTKSKFDCSVCIHHLSGSCAVEEDLPNGCEYWRDMVADKSVPMDQVPYWVG